MVREAIRRQISRTPAATGDPAAAGAAAPRPASLPGKTGGRAAVHPPFAEMPPGGFAVRGNRNARRLRAGRGEGSL